jgi:streptomycin 3"-adenylyltransferase
VTVPLDDPESRQIEGTLAIVRDVLGDRALGAYLSGSAVAGGLRPRSDLDVFVVTSGRTRDDERRHLTEALMEISGSRALRGPGRSLEVTIAVQSDVVPWRYPPRMDFQYGDWFRPEYTRGNMAPWHSPNPDLAVLLTTVRKSNRVLFGRPAGELLEPVPRKDLRRAMLDGIPGLLADLDQDTANVMLTLARIWATLVSGAILSKDAAADWALARLPPGRREVLARARGVYLGEAPDTWDDLGCPGTGTPSLRRSCDSVPNDDRFEVFARYDDRPVVGPIELAMTSSRSLSRAPLPSSPTASKDLSVGLYQRRKLSIHASGERERNV